MPSSPSPKRKKTKNAANTEDDDDSTTISITTTTPLSPPQPIIIIFPRRHIAALIVGFIAMIVAVVVIIYIVFVRPSEEEAGPCLRNCGPHAQCVKRRTATEPEQGGGGGGGGTGETCRCNVDQQLRDDGTTCPEPQCSSTFCPTSYYKCYFIDESYQVTDCQVNCIPAGKVPENCKNGDTTTVCGVKCYDHMGNDHTNTSMPCDNSQLCGFDMTDGMIITTADDLNKHADFQKEYFAQEDPSGATGALHIYKCQDRCAHKCEPVVAPPDETIPSLVTCKHHEPSESQRPVALIVIFIFITVVCAVWFARKKQQAKKWKQQHQAYLAKLPTIQQEYQALFDEQETERLEALKLQQKKTEREMAKSSSPSPSKEAMKITGHREWSTWYNTVWTEGKEYKDYLKKLIDIRQNPDSNERVEKMFELEKAIRTQQVMAEGRAGITYGHKTGRCPCVQCAV